MGKLVDAAGTTVFLTKGDRTYLVRLGDTVEGTYRVEEIGDLTMTFTYLPLDTKQSFAIGSPALTREGTLEPGPEASAIPLPLRADAPPTHNLTRLVWMAPPKVEIGGEFTIEVGLPAGPQSRAGQVELVYDTMLLALLGGATRQVAAGPRMQRAVVDIIGPGFQGGQPTPSEVRFRVLTGNPTNTQIAIENLSATTSDGRALVIESPSTHPLTIIEGSGRLN